ncbi:hypothetical protein SO802_010644 [Lithocarpus litseifolius]|uniref:Uncharacterized protein n=1 Tax=Lithocarpus litseifolius TaxID=425828 RepID=A0AAW2DES3_9ROSI
MTLSLSNAVVVALPQKRPSLAMNEGFLRRNYSAMAAAAAVAEADDVKDGEEGDVEEREGEEVVVEREGMRRLDPCLIYLGKARFTDFIDLVDGFDSEFSVQRPGFSTARGSLVV